VTEKEKYEALEEFLDSLGDKQSVTMDDIKDFAGSGKQDFSIEDVVDFLSANGITVIGFQRFEEPKYTRKDDPLWLYIREVGKVKILGKERELEVAQRMEDTLHVIRKIIPGNIITTQYLLKIGAMVETREIPLDEFTKATAGDPDATTEEKRADVAQVLSNIDKKLKEIKDYVHSNRSKANTATFKKKIAKFHKDLLDEVESLELSYRTLYLFTPIFQKVKSRMVNNPLRLNKAAKAADIDPDKLRTEADKVLDGKSTMRKMTKSLKINTPMAKQLTILRRKEKQVEKCLDFTSLIPREDLMEEYSKIPEYWEKYEECKRLLIEANVRLVINIAKNYANQGVEFLDLIQEGNAALIKAVERFDPSRGFKLGTYAIWWIRQAMLRTLAEQSHVVKLPTYLVQWIRRYARTTQELSQKFGREPTPQEVSEAMDVTPDKSDKLQKFFTGQVSLNKSLGDDDSRTLEDMIPDESTGSPSNMANLTMLQTELKRVLETLTPKEQRVISLRFGLDDNYPRTLEEIGKIFDLSRERIRQIEMKALSKLRHPSKLEKLLPYFRE